MVDNATRKNSVVLMFGDQEICLQEDWTQGIGGGLWSTGMALAKYFGTDHSQRQLRSLNIQRVLELGSGNGFLAVCLLASLHGKASHACNAVMKDVDGSTSLCHHRLDHLVVTDTQEHVALMKSTIFEANRAILEKSPSTKVHVSEYLWGTGPLCLTDELCPTFDLILGSDLAYRDELHDPLISTLLDCSGPRTLTLLGVTMNDTKPIFFAKLNRAGLQYERLADHLLEPDFRGRNFGIFVIRRRSS